MRRLCISIIAILSVISMGGRVCSQSNGSFNPATMKWPQDPPVGIGSATAGTAGPQNALHIHFDPSPLSPTWPAIMRLSRGVLTTTDTFGILGLLLHDTSYTSLSSELDLVLKQQAKGDIIITNYTRTGTVAYAGTANIRFATTGDTLLRTVPPGPHDLERMTITADGNIGMNLPPDPITGQGNPMDQFQLGGGSAIPPGYSDTIPGLTFFGGSRYEGLPRLIGGVFPVDWRYIGSNYWIDHNDNSLNRFKRITAMDGSAIKFANNTGGLLQLDCYPYDATRGLNDFGKGIAFTLTGNTGLEMWSDEGAGNSYHHLFDVWRPGHVQASWDSVRNDSGLFIHYTPVYIGFGQNWQLPNFTDLPGVRPTLGDQKTWMLAVNGSALFKEVCVFDTVWADYVFDAKYKLRPLSEVEQFIEANHHLPDVPSAQTIKTSGLSIAATEATTMQKVEELTLYIIDLKNEVEALKAEVLALKTGGK